MLARDLVQRLGGRWNGGSGTVRCPAHDDRTPSLSISDGEDRVLVHCFAGCPQASVIEALQHRGLWPKHEPRQVGQKGHVTAKPKRERSEAYAEHQERALDVWRTSQPIEGTPAETYLRSRGLDYMKMPVYEPGRWPASLAWNQDAIRKAGVKSQAALVIAVNDCARGGLVCAVQRIFLNANGTPVLDATGKKRKLSLGRIHGNAARLLCPTDPAGRWGLAEGVESALAARQIFGFATWSAISAANMSSVVPPSWARHATIFADNDSAGMKAAAKAAERYRQRPGIETVRVVRMTEPGADAADALKVPAHG
jgi:hypothetical protein